MSIAVCAATHADRESQQKSQEGHAEDTVPAVTHIRLKMKVAPASRSGGGALMIYDVAINARDPSTRQDHKFVSENLLRCCLVRDLSLWSCRFSTELAYDVEVFAVRGVLL